MKKILTLALAAASLMTAASATAADAPVKQEMRSAWVATVWRLDWPTSTISSTGNETQINYQKNDMTRLLDSLYTNNFNAMMFQVRSRCDAMYPSSFEPWSSDLVENRGMDPGYDPLAFVVEECHKRGIECYAWLNPYRYESVAHQWDGTPNNYREEHPDWLIDVTSSSGTTASILNPGLPEVTQRICDIIAEIVTNYDVDGVLFDDYFYLSGTTSAHDGNLYNAYKDAGGTLSIGDWRRDNVNRMIESVYTTIKGIKPWVRFGVSPAGIACTSSSIASRYGITPCPTGSDWQYNDIYSDPIAWVSSQNLDFISPQIYWTIGNSTNYDKASKWWSYVADKFGRHMYVSHSISSLNANSQAPAQAPVLHASGPNSTSFEEYANEVRLNREYSLDGAPGSVFYSAKYLYRNAPLFSHYLGNTVFNTRALVPAMTWFHAENPGMVKNLNRVGNTLEWDAMENMRYTVYAWPEERPIENFDRDAEYLLDVTYENHYTLPDEVLAGYNYGVCVLDRYGNEYSAATPGVAASDLAAPVLVAPASGSNVEAPFWFEWQAVEGATSYIIEVALDSEMTRWVATRSTSSTSVISDELAGLPINTTVYWRVRACGPNYNDGVSASSEVYVTSLQIVSPQDCALDVDLSPVFQWNNPEKEAELQISDNHDFTGEHVYSAVDTGSHQVAPYRLSAYTQYFARLVYIHNGLDRVSPIVEFTTRAVDSYPAPAIAVPQPGATVYSDEHFALEPVEGVCGLRIEVSASTTFPSRSSYLTTNIPMDTWTDPKAASDIRVGTKYMVDGETYYIRARANYRTPDGVVSSEYTEPVAFVYSASTGVADAAASKFDVRVADGLLVVNAPAKSVIKVCNPAGVTVATSVGTSLKADLQPGVYFVSACGSTVKVVVK